MKHLGYYLLLFLIAGLILCCNNIREKPNCNIENEVHMNLNLPDSLFSHFPENNDDNNINEQDLIVKGNNVSQELQEIDRFIPVTWVSVYEIKTHFTPPSEYTHFVSVEDDDYFIINDIEYLSVYWSDDLLIKKYSKLKAKQLLPDFDYYLSDVFSFKNESYCGLSEEFDIYVIKAGSIFVLPDENKNQCDVLPKRISHGYNLGIAYSQSKNIVIYWLIAW